MRILITGSRHWDSRYGATRIETILNLLHALSDTLGQKLTVVHGGCATGADQAVDRWARRREDDGVTVEVYPAQWARFNKAAGPMRNQEMVDRGADLCIGFVRGTSPGTRHCLALARNAKIATFTVNWEEERE